MAKNNKPTRAQRRARKSKSYAEQFAHWLGDQAEAEDNGEPTEPEYERSQPEL
jgi:hypothetical protein